ncbi:MAG: DUF3082 domain-containing protein [Leptolyngbyaceae bacterium]|nr:DUF3082 domain-containing protein [Leptolyngbyaceae bacterium]
MTDLPSNPSPATQSSDVKNPPSPWQCLMGSLTSGVLAFACYQMTMAIAQTFAAKPIHSINETVLRIASAVRTLVVGMSALGAGVFGLVALGLAALAVQIVIQQVTGKSASN